MGPAEAPEDAAALLRTLVAAAYIVAAIGVCTASQNRAAQVRRVRSPSQRIYWMTSIGGQVAGACA